MEENNLILLNVKYQRPDKKRNIKECFVATYKDNNDNVYMSTTPADLEIYFTKEEYRSYNYNIPQEQMSHCYTRIVPYSQIKFAIANEIGDSGKKFVDYCFENKDYKSLDKLYGWPYSFKADFLPEFYFMQDWSKKHGIPSNVKLTKAFMDIEIDQIDVSVNLNNIASSAVAPINTITVIYDDKREVYTFILKPQKPSTMGRNKEEYDKRYKLYEKQLNDHNVLMSDVKKFIFNLENEFESKYGIFKYHIREYDEEIELIADVFRYINDRKPNFCMTWNMRFDIQYILHRIKTLGYNPADIMCHPDFENKMCYFIEDMTTFNMAKQFDIFQCSSYTQYICQMRTYASARKSQHKLRSMKLNYIADRELKDRKVEYPENSNIITFAYIDWINFIKYNIKDTLLCVFIERNTNDIMTFYMRSITNMTPYSKIFRETHLLRNVREMYFEEQGFIQGNNINIIGLDDHTIQLFDIIQDDDDNDEDDEHDQVDNKRVSFKGAINADPIWNEDVYYHNCLDQDMTGFYPACKCFSNMDPSTLLYKASFINNEFINGECVNNSLNQTYEEIDKNKNTRIVDITGEAIQTYLSGNILTFASNWLNMPSITTMYNEYMNSVK